MKEDIYTFSPDEKEVLLILESFEKELEEKLQESKSEIERVKYYEKFKIYGMDFNNIFVTTEKDVDGNISYHVYCGDSSNEIIRINSDGQAEINSELEKFFGEIDIEQLMEENEEEKGRLKGISEKTTPEEIEKTIKEKQIKGQQTEQEQKDEEAQQIEEDLREQGEDISIGKHRKIKDNNLSEKMPEIFEENEESEIGFDNKQNRFVIFTKENGKYQIKNEIEPAKPTMKTVISIDENGKEIENKVPHALMKVTGNKERELAVYIDQYGYIDLEAVQVLPCKERIARGIRMQGEGMEKEESYQLKEEFKTEGKEYSHNLAHQVNEIQETEQELGDTDNTIKEEDYIPNTQITWKELMEETGESLPKLIERYDREMLKENVDSKTVVKTIQKDYGLYLTNRE